MSAVLAAFNNPDLFPWIVWFLVVVKAHLNSGQLDNVESLISSK